MTADNFLWPDQLIMGLEHLPSRAHDEPNGYSSRDQWVKERIAGQAHEKSGCDWRKRYPNIPDIVNISEPDRGVVSARLEEQPRHAPIRGGSGYSDDDW